jgi:excisionase family DNA binding protein
MADGQGIGLDELAAHPERAVELRDEERRCVVSQLAALIILLQSSVAAAPVGSAAPPEPGAERLLTVPATAERLGFAKSYVYEIIRRGELRAVRRGKYVRVRQSAIEEWTRAHEKA